jgi:Tol biopolymer transport system component
MKTQNCLVYNSEGHIWKFDLASGSETVLNTGECDNCNNDHVLSPDERYIAVSHGPREGGYSSRVYIIPMEGGEARLVTPNSPSYLHGWSPDGKELAYCAFRMHGENLEVDVYSIPAEGGEETRLTFGGFNDGPEYAPDGKSIWFNSTRSGKMQIWRMGRDGSDPVRMTPCERNNWFAHVSPDGEKVVYISYGAEDLLPNEHLPNMRVELRIMNADGSGDRRLLSFFGGQGSMNVNSWAPDSRHIAFVSYEILHK